MFFDVRRLFLLLTLLFAVSAFARESKPIGKIYSPPQSNALTQPFGKINLDVVVTPKSGPPVSGLQQQDFTLLDNKVPRPITSFQAVGGTQSPIEVLLVVDAVNIGYDHVAFARQEIEQFLRANGGHLAFPTAIAVFTDTGTEVSDNFSTDGNALSSSLEQYTVSLRTIPRSAGFYGATERFQLSLDAFHQLAVRAASLPGRKLILWVSPGWPILSGPEVQLDSKQQQQIFTNIVNFSTLLQQGHITLYSADPLGTADFNGRAFNWEPFQNGISKASQTDMGDLALQVIAKQSGGLALSIGNDVSLLLQKCLADTTAYYELSFDPAIGDHPHEYHHLQVKVAKSGVTARTRQGYYTQP